MQPEPLPARLIWAPLVQAMSNAQSLSGIIHWNRPKTLLPEVKQMIFADFRGDPERFRQEAGYFMGKHPPLEDIGFIKALLLADTIRDTNGCLSATDYNKLRTPEPGWQEAVALLKSNL
jgi:hypothetical protein